MPGDSFKILL